MVPEGKRATISLPFPGENEGQKTQNGYKPVVLKANHPFDSSSPSRLCLNCLLPFPLAPSPLHHSIAMPVASSRRHSTDPLDEALKPPPDETPEQREIRLAQEAEARRVSQAIDAGIKAERQAQRKKRIVRLLLLGQSESGMFPAPPMRLSAI